MGSIARAAVAALLVGMSYAAPAASIWFSAGSSVYRLDTSSNQAELIGSTGPVQAVTVNPQDGTGWALAGSRLLKLSESGVPLVDLDLKNLGVQFPAGLALNPYDASLWIADGKTLLKLGPEGQALATWPAPGVLRTLALSIDENLWALGNKQLWRYSAQGALTASQNLTVLGTAEPKFLMVDSLGEALWLAGEKQLIQLKLSNPGQVTFTFASSQIISGLALDQKHGNLWVLAQDRLTGIARDGHILKAIDLGALGLTGAALAYDSASESLWVGHASGLARFSSGGELTATVTTGAAVTAIGVAPFVLAPSVSLVRPPQNALTNNPRPLFTLAYDALCADVACGFTPQYFATYSLTALLNQQPVGNLFTFDGATGQANFTPPLRLPEGANTFTAQVQDAFGHHSHTVINTFTVDTVPPKFLTLSPAEGSVFANPHVTFQGTIDDPSASVVLDGVGPASNTSASGTALAFSLPVTLAAGLNTVNLTAIDKAGNSATASLRLTFIPLNVAIDTPQNGAVINAEFVTVTGSVQGPPATRIAVNGIQASLDGNRFSAANVPLQVGTNALTALATAPDSTAATGQISVMRTVSPPADTGTGPIPPDPATVAPAVNKTVASLLAQTTAFLYSGASPIQTGVAPGTIEVRRAAVLRGRVRTRDNQPLPGVKITVLGHPEFGQTLSRADGMFDMAVNGGGVLTVRYEKPGFMSAQRQVQAPWQDFAFASDVVMVPYDTRVTTIELGGSSAMQVAQGSAVTDGDGTRKATILFPQGVTATLVKSDGTTQPLTTLNVRATEYTVGPNGPKAMPAPLPPTSGYTYAVELSVDEAVAANAKEVRFSQPVPFYVENFLNFPVGGIVPAGYYDRDKAAWIPSDNGRVIKILAIVNGLAELDVSGSGLPADAVALAALGIIDAERAQLAALYSAGQSLWRVPVSHFTPWDLNWPYGPPPDGTDPKQPEPQDDAKQKKEDKPDAQCNSIIECQNQTLGERLRIAGTPSNLNYRSSRVPGNISANALNISLSGGSVPASLKRIELVINVAGRQFTQTFSAVPNQSYTFIWDGKDAYGRGVQGTQPVTIRIGYVYDAIYQQPAQLIQSFGAVSGIPITGSRARNELTFWQESRKTISTWDARVAGLGGWTLDIHHAYDPIGQILYLGNGTRRSGQSVNAVINTIAGGGVGGASLSSPHHIALDAQGNVFVADTFASRILKISIDGMVSAVATVVYVRGVALAPDGTLYFSAGFDLGGGVGKVNSDGTVTVLAELPYAAGIAVDAQGNVFFSDGRNAVVRKIDRSGVITAVAGDGRSSNFGRDGVPATATSLGSPKGLAVDAQGNLFIADQYRIRKVSPDGIISTVAGDGSGTPAFRGDGGPATSAWIYGVDDIALDNQGNLFLTDTFNHRIRKIAGDGIITTVAGNGIASFAGDGGPATAASLNQPAGIGIDTLGNLFIVDTFNSRIRKVTLPLPGVGINDLLIPSADGTELYHFDFTGRHLRTLNAKTNAVLYTFGYDSTGYLIQVTDGDGNRTVIERDASGQTTGIVSPDGQRTALTLDTNGYLVSATNPAGEAYRMAYTPDGLLTGFTDPKGNASAISYDSLGRLIKDQNAANGFWAVSRVELANGYEAALTSALNRTTTYRVEQLSTGDRRRTNTYPDGSTKISLIATNGTTTDTQTDGSVVTTLQGPDPRFGMQAPIDKSTSVQLPSGLTSTTTVTRNVSLADPKNLLSLVSQTDQITVNGRLYTSLYDAGLKQFTRTSPLGRSSLTQTDSQGRIVFRQAPGVAPASYAYDTRGRLQSVTQGTGADARLLTLAYNAQGFLGSITDALGRTMGYQYELAGRITQQTLPDGRVIQFGYDANGNVTGMTPPGRPQHAFGYTPVDLEEQYTPPVVAGVATAVTRYSYNLDKQLTTITRPDGQIVSLAYDGGGRLAALSTPAGDLGYTYEAATGNLRSLTAPGGIGLSYTYDGFLPLAETWAGPVTGTVARSYNSDFSVTGLAVNGASIPFGYDNDGLLVQAGDLVVTRAATNGFITGTALGSTATGQAYTTFGELQSFTVSQGGSPLLSFDLTYDKLGRVAEKLETVQGITDHYAYGYDGAGRLAQVTRNGTPNAPYVYDANGNRVANGAFTGTYDEQDRLVQYGNTTYAYTDNGEIKSKTSGAQTTSYAYDALGNLRAATLPDGTLIEYLIDGRNRRIGKKVNGVLKQGFLYQNGLNPVAELDGANNVVSRFVYGTKRNVPDYLLKGGVTYRIVSDHLGSPRLIINTATGDIAQRMDYDEFGRVVLDTNPGFQPFGFAGGLYDPETKLVRFGARDYDAETGRWTAKDPIRFDGGDANLYRYVGGNPVSRIDPTGEGWKEIIQAIGIAIGLAGSPGVGPDKPQDPLQVPQQTPVDPGKVPGRQLPDPARSPAQTPELPRPEAPIPAAPRVPGPPPGGVPGCFRPPIPILLCPACRYLLPDPADDPYGA